MSKIQLIKNAVQSKAGLQILKIRKHSPALLFGAGVVGVTATVVLACRATLKVEEILDETKADIEEAARIHDRFDSSESEKSRGVSKVYVHGAFRIAKLYTPAVLVGTASIAALTGSHVILNRRYAGATAAYAAISQGFTQYRKRVEERFGSDVERELRYGVTEREIVEEGPDGPEVKTIKQASSDGGSIYSMYFDSRSRNFQRDPGTNIMFLKMQQKHLNQRLQANGYLFLSDVLDALDLPQTPASRVVGWVKDADEEGKGDGYVSFVDHLVNGSTQEARDFFNGHRDSILLDFNVDGEIMWALA